MLEAQILTWLSANWPSAVLGLSVALVYVSAWSRLNTFLMRIEKDEKETLRQGRELVTMKTKIAQLCMIHCKRHGEDLERLMKVEEDGNNDN